nr:hypothetical protein GCM10025732_47780 [Glycomyces mayteni]
MAETFDALGNPIEPGDRIIITRKVYGNRPELFDTDCMSVSGSRVYYRPNSQEKRWDFQTTHPYVTNKQVVSITALLSGD